MIWAVRQVELRFKTINLVASLSWLTSVCFTIKVALPPAALTGHLTNDQWMVRSITVIMHCRNELKISTVLLHNLSFGRIKTFIYLNWLEASNNYLVRSTYQETQNKNYNKSSKQLSHWKTSMDQCMWWMEKGTVF